MKKNLFFILLVTAIFSSSCMKDYGDDEVVPNNGNSAPELRVTGANSVSNDTVFAEPNIFLKFWLDELPGSASDYSYNWSLAEGSYSTLASPEKKYQSGTYAISVIITPTISGNTITREITLVIRPGAGNRTVVLHSVTLLSNGSYDYAIALKSTAIYNYDNMSGEPWTNGDWTNWQLRYLSETTTINGILYVIDHVVLPANNQNKQRFVFGRGGTYAYDPDSPYWVVTGSGEGVFEVYLTNGQMSPDPITSTAIPGHNGDVVNGEILPTIRNEIKYSGIPYNDSIKIIVNYAVYANGSQPYISRMLSNNDWQDIPLIKLSGEFTGWAYQTYRLQDLVNGLYFRFGPNISSPANYGDMSHSKYYISDGNMLGLQISGSRSSEYSFYPINH